MSVDMLQLSVRAYNAIKNAEIKTVEELVQKSEADVLRWKNCGQKALNNIKEELKGMGLRLGMKIVPPKPKPVTLQDLFEMTASRLSYIEGKADEARIRLSSVGGSMEKLLALPRPDIRALLPDMEKRLSDRIVYLEKRVEGVSQTLDKRLGQAISELHVAHTQFCDVGKEELNWIIKNLRQQIAASPNEIGNQKREIERLQGLLKLSQSTLTRALEIIRLCGLELTEFVESVAPKKSPPTG